MFRLVGADRDDLLAGILGGKSIVRIDSLSPADSDIVLLRGATESIYPGPLNFDDCDKGAEVSELLRLLL